MKTLRSFYVALVDIRWEASNIPTLSWLSLQQHSPRNPIMATGTRHREGK